MMSEDQSQALQQYTESTTGILGYLKNQLSSVGFWTNVPGTLSKVVSSAGYSWGVGQDGKKVYFCKEPCTGSWEPMREELSVLDIASDTTNVYILISTIENIPDTASAAPPAAVAPPPPPPPPAPVTTKPTRLLGLAEAVTNDLPLLQSMWGGSTAKDPGVFRLIVINGLKTQAEIQVFVYYNASALGKYNFPLPALPDNIQKDVDEKALFMVLDYGAQNGLPAINPNAAQRALLANQNNAAAAVQWLFLHGSDAGINDAFPVPTAPPAPPPPPPPPPPKPNMIPTTVYKYLKLPGDPTTTNMSNYSVQKVPFKATSISITNGYVWVSGNSKMAFCAKPCATGGWTIKDDPHSLLGAGGTSIYAKDPATSALVKTDETAQTGWVPVGGFAGLSPLSVGAEADNTALYGSDSKNLYRCDGTCDSEDKLEEIDTQGYLPIGAKGSISVNPTTKNVWLASSSSGSGGNLFQRLDGPNIDPVLNHVNDNQKERDRIFNTLGGAEEIQIYKISSDIAKQESNDAIKKSIDIGGKLEKVDDQISLLQRKVQTATAFSGDVTSRLVPLQILLFSLALVVLMYFLTGWVISQTVLMWVSVLILSVGFGLAIYFSTVT